jgi:hypothetical protein
MHPHLLTRLEPTFRSSFIRFALSAHELATLFIRGLGAELSEAAVARIRHGTPGVSSHRAVISTRKDAAS